MAPPRPRSTLWINGNALFWLGVVWAALSGASGLCVGLIGGRWAGAAVAVAIGAAVSMAGFLIMRAANRREREVRSDD